MNSFKNQSKQFFNMAVVLGMAFVFGCEDPIVNLGRDIAGTDGTDGTDGIHDWDGTDHWDGTGGRAGADDWDDTDNPGIIDLGRDLDHWDDSDDLRERENRDIPEEIECWKDWSSSFDVPLAWVSAVDCGSVGDSCANMDSCGGDSFCETEALVCIPKHFEGDRVCGPEYPYFLSQMCMTYEEASCFCFGAGSAIHPECSVGPKAIMDLCISPKR